jgi:Ca2+-transporting ATPase
MRVVRFLTASGEVVAMTGDGVNDAPALRAASIGVALGSGTEVAQEASDLILQNNSFSVIVAAIEEGRRIIDNLRKIIAYLLSTSFSEIIVVGGALALGFPIPLLPAQILWTNMLSEGFMNFAFAFEPKEDDLMTRDPKVSGARMMLSKTLMIFIVTVGAISGLLLLGMYWLLLTVEMFSPEEARTLVFVALTLGTTITAFSFKDLRASILHVKLWSNRYLLGSLFFALFGLFIALYVPAVREVLRLVPVDLKEEAPLLVAVIVLNLAAIELAKFVLFERRNKKR